MDSRHEYLVHGYMKQEFAAAKGIDLSDLFQIILTLLGNILLNFDIFNSNNKDEVMVMEKE